VALVQIQALRVDQTQQRLRMLRLLWLQQPHQLMLQQLPLLQVRQLPVDLVAQLQCGHEMESFIILANVFAIMDKHMKL